MLIRTLAAAVAVLLASCAIPPTAATCLERDKACLQRAIEAHAVKGIAYWSGEMSRPVAARIGAAPPTLVEFLNLDNMAHDFPDRPKTAVLEPDFLVDLQGAIADMPPSVWRLFDRRLAGIFLVEDLGGTGYTDIVLDAQGKEVAGFVVLDAGVLRSRTANAWATWKENTPFRPTAGYALQARIEMPARDNRRNAIQYILLHELAHVLSIGENFHPSWNVEVKDVPVSASFPFLELSWRLDRERDRTDVLPAHDFTQQKSVSYYFGAKLDAKDMAPTYANLAKTNFPSLYASTRPGDDFAESFASYVHTVMMGGPWEIEITRPDAPAFVFKACWDEARCAAKRRMLEAILAR